MYDTKWQKYTSLYICPQPKKCTTPRENSNVKLWTLGNYVNVGSSIITNEPLWRGDMIIEEATHVWDRR